MEAVNLIGGLFNADMANVRESGRIRGMTIRPLRSRQEVRQRRPLTVDMVMALEQIVLDSDGTSDERAIIAGAALFATFGRIRIGDMRKCSIEPIAQVAASKCVGTVDTRFHFHKTARAGTGKALPIAAPAFGLTSGRSWALVFG